MVLFRDNVMGLLEKLFQLRLVEDAIDVIKKGLDVIAKYFNLIVEKSGFNVFNFFDSKNLIRLTRKNNLVVSSEMLVFKVINEYIKNHPNLSQEESEALFETVRFPFLSFGINMKSSLWIKCELIVEFRGIE